MEINLMMALGLTTLSGMVAILTQRVCLEFIKIKMFAARNDDINKSIRAVDLSDKVP